MFTTNTGFTYDEQVRIADAQAKIPAHLDAEEIVLNSYQNACDVPREEQVDCIVATIMMYIDQDCSSF